MHTLVVSFSEQLLRWLLRSTLLATSKHRDHEARHDSTSEWCRTSAFCAVEYVSLSQEAGW
jgi:hypothetical protein